MRLQAQRGVTLVRGSQRTLTSRTAILRSSDVEAIAVIVTQVCPISTAVPAIATRPIRVAWRWRSSTLTNIM